MTSGSRNLTSNPREASRPAGGSFNPEAGERLLWTPTAGQDLTRTLFPLFRPPRESPVRQLVRRLLRRWQIEKWVRAARRPGAPRGD